jgi:hypothetical protein
MSVERRLAQAGALYINATDMRSTVFLSDGSTRAPWIAALGPLSTSGAATFRDMGKLVYIPDPTVYGGAAPSTILRKVQYIPTGAAQTGNGVGGEATGSYYSGCVRVGAVDGVSGGLVRIA